MSDFVQRSAGCGWGVVVAVLIGLAPAGRASGEVFVKRPIAPGPLAARAFSAILV